MVSIRLGDRVLVALALSGLMMAACAPSAPPPSTRSPVEPQAAATDKPTAKTETVAPQKAAEAPAKQSAKPAAPQKAEAAGSSFNEGVVSEFYSGKTIRIMVGFAPGGGFDIWARLIAKHLRDYVPGNPNVIVENKPGAGSLLVANTVYKSEPNDGTVIGAFSEQLVLQEALGKAGIEFEARRFNWLGSAHVSQSACMVHREAGITDIKQVMGPAARAVAMGGESPGTLISDTPAVLNAALGTNFRIVYGYKGAAPIQSAIQSREVDGMCFTWDSIRATLKDWFEPEPMVTVPIITGQTVPDDPWLKGTVAAEAIAPDEEARKLLAAAVAPGTIAKPYAVGPDVPADRVAALRGAFERTFRDPEFVAEVKRIDFPLAPKNGQQVTAVVGELLSLPPELVGKLKQALQP